MGAEASKSGERTAEESFPDRLERIAARSAAERVYGASGDVLNGGEAYLGFVQDALRVAKWVLRE